jgi:predicted Zn-dependent peptidase
LASSVSLFSTFLNRSGALFARTAFSPENEDEVREAFEEELVRLIQDGIATDELERAINHAIGVHEINLESRRDRTLEFARAVISGDGLSTVTEFASAVRGVTRELVNATAARYLSPAFAKIVVLRGGR